MLVFVLWAVAAGDSKCWWGTVTDGGSEGPPPEILNLVDLIACIMYFGDGHYLLPITYYSNRFIAYILTCRAWTSLNCIHRPTSWPFHQPLLFDRLLLFWYWDQSWSLSYSVHFLWVSTSVYVTYLFFLSITLLQESNSSTERGGKCLQLSAS